MLRVTTERSALPSALAPWALLFLYHIWASFGKRQCMGGRVVAISVIWPFCQYGCHGEGKITHQIVLKWVEYGDYGR